MLFFNKQERLNKRFLKAIKEGRDLTYVRNILDKGADIHCVGNEETALFFITKKTPIKVVEYLVKQGLDVNTSVGSSGELVIMHAVGLKNEDILEFLLEKTKDLNHRNTMGSSLIMYAVYFSNEELVKKLLDKNVDISFKTDQGKDVFDICKNYHIAELLAAYILKITEQNNDTLESGWHIISADEIAHIHLLEAISREITEIFNFASERKMKIVRNLQTNAESHSECGLFEVENSVENKKLETAASLLHNKDPKVDLTSFKNRAYKVVDGKMMRKSSVKIVK